MAQQQNSLEAFKKKGHLFLIVRRFISTLKLAVTYQFQYANMADNQLNGQKHSTSRFPHHQTTLNQQGANIPFHKQSLIEATRDDVPRTQCLLLKRASRPEPMGWNVICTSRRTVSSWLITTKHLNGAMGLIRRLLIAIGIMWELLGRSMSHTLGFQGYVICLNG